MGNFFGREATMLTAKRVDGAVDGFDVARGKLLGREASIRPESCKIAFNLYSTHPFRAVDDDAREDELGIRRVVLWSSS